MISDAWLSDCIGGNLRVDDRCTHTSIAIACNIVLGRSVMYPSFSAWTLWVPDAVIDAHMPRR